MLRKRVMCPKNPNPDLKRQFLYAAEIWMVNICTVQSMNLMIKQTWFKFQIRCGHSTKKIETWHEELKPAHLRMMVTRFFILWTIRISLYFSDRRWCSGCLMTNLWIILFPRIYESRMVLIWQKLSLVTLTGWCFCLIGTASREAMARDSHDSSMTISMLTGHKVQP